MSQTTKKGVKMSKKIEQKQFFFSEGIEEIFLEEEDPQYKIFKATIKLLGESIDAIGNLGEFVDIKIQEGIGYIDNHETCDPSQYITLERDLIALQGMLTYLLDNRNKKKSHAVALPDNLGDEIKEPFMVFFARKFNKKSRIINPK